MSTNTPTLVVGGTRQPAAHLSVRRAGSHAGPQPTLIRSGQALAETIDAFEELMSTASDIVRRGRSAGVDLSMLGLTSLDRRARGYAGETTDWVVVPAERDPLLRRTGTIPMPRHARQALTRALSVVDFPTMLLAHEVPKGVVSSMPGVFETGSLASDPLVRGDHLLHSISDVAPTTAVRVRAASLADRITYAGGCILVATAVAVAVAPAVAVAAPAALVALAGLDPILIGILPWQGRTDPGTPCALFEITRWAW